MLCRNKNALHDGGAIEEGGGKHNVQADRALTTSDSTTPQPRKQAVSDLLLHGAENAMSGKELADLMGYTSVRDLQKQIAVERSRGALILSNTGGGYYLPALGEAGRKELRRYLRTIRARAFNTLKAGNAARLALMEVEGQMAIEGGAVCADD